MDNSSITWETLEYEYKKRGVDWYWAVATIALVLVVISIVMKNYFFAVLVVVATFSIYMFAVRHPMRIRVSIERDGVRIGNEFHPFGTLRAFWIESKNGREKLLLESSKTFSPLLVVTIEGVPGEIIREALAERIPETEIHEPFIHALMQHI